MKITMRSVLAVGACLALGPVCLAQPSDAAQRAKDLFGAKKLPSAAAPQSFGFYSKGCFAGGVALPTDGPTWQVMRPSRNRNWGHPAMVALIERLSREAVADGWPGLLVGDISEPRGGPMPTGHASHQIGLDADIWFRPMPATPYSLDGREKIGAVSMLRPGTHLVDDNRWSEARTRLLKRAASYPEVERIFVNPGIKKKLCDTVTGDRGWMNKIRPFWGHDEHFHIRMSCQPGSPNCKPQHGTGSGDGCGKELAWWFTEEPWRPNKNPDAPKARDLMTMADLPKQCQAVLDAPDPVSVAAVTYRPGMAIPAAAAVPSIASVDALPAAAAAFAATPDSGVPVPRPRPAR
jgi:penicillin-insensitive murein endopeptidase